MRPNGKFPVRVDIGCDDLARARVHADAIFRVHPDNIRATVRNGDVVLIDEARDEWDKAESEATS